MQAVSKKIKTLDQLESIVRQLQDGGSRAVLTNGCFDLLHAGHVRYLRKARACGDALIVAVNSDASVRRLKGAGRPIVRQEDRCEVLAALECVDHVTVFDDDTPLDVVKRLRPAVLAKGGDWQLDQIVGRKEVEEAGGRVMAIEFEKGYSTTSIVRRIVEASQAYEPN